MKIRNGFISIMALIVMSVVMIMVLYLLYTAGLEHLILNSTSNNIQSYYLSEGKIFMSLYEDKYYLGQLYPGLLEYFRSYSFSRQPNDIIIDGEDLELGDNEKNLDISIVDKDNRKYLKVISKSDYRGLKSETTSLVSLVNEVFEIGEPVLDINSIDTKYKNGLENLIEKISKEISINSCKGEENIYGAEFSNFNDILLYKKDDGNFEINSYRETMEEPFVECFIENDVFIIIRSFGENPTTFFIGDLHRSNKKVQLSGVIYVEGNIIISSNFEFNGIIIVKDGEISIDETIDTNVNGIIITDNINNNDFVELANIRYYKFFIYKYGTYLPGFIELVIESIKSN